MTVAQTLQREPVVSISHEDVPRNGQMHSNSSFARPRHKDTRESHELWNGRVFVSQTYNGRSHGHGRIPAEDVSLRVLLNLLYLQTKLAL